MPPPLTIPTIPDYDSLSEEEREAVWARLPHDNMASLPLSVAAICIGFSSLAVSLRLYTRRYIMRGEVGMDDIFAIVSLVRRATHPAPFTLSIMMRNNTLFASHEVATRSDIVAHRPSSMRIAP